jgi:hypothetical protein
MTLSQIAINATNQLNTQFNQYTWTFMGETNTLAYTGQPVFTSNQALTPTGFPLFSSQLGCPTFRVNCSAHVITIFNASETPSLITVNRAMNDGPLTGLTLTDVSGQTLSNTQIAALIEFASAKVVAAINNQICLATYIHEDVGSYQKSFFLRPPVIYFDGVWSKRPYSFSLYGIFLGGSSSIIWNLNRSSGELAYIPAQNCYYSYEPTSPENEIKISYVAGYYRIPIAVEIGVLNYMVYLLENKADVKSLKAGTWAVEFKDTPIIDRIREDLQQYIIWWVT